MSPEERQLLVGLFERTRSAAASPRDQEAEAFINDQVKAQPAAPYLLAQTVIVQEHALQGANQRLQQLEAQVRELEAKAQKGAGSFLGGLLGGAVAPGASAPPPPRPAPPPGHDQPQGGPWGAQPYAPQGGYAPPPGYGQQSAAPAGGGFLKGALGMAAGVAGGALLANSIQGLFHGGAGGMGGLAGGNLGIGSGYAPAMHETVVNNYYGDAAPGQDDDQVQDAGYDDDGVDNGDDSYDV